MPNTPRTTQRYQRVLFSPVQPRLTHNIRPNVTITPKPRGLTSTKNVSLPGCEFGFSSTGKSFFTRYNRVRFSQHAVPRRRGEQGLYALGVQPAGNP